MQLKIETMKEKTAASESKSASGQALASASASDSEGLIQSVALHRLVFRREASSLHALLQKKTHDVNHRDSHGNNPLHIAIMLGECVHTRMHIHIHIYTHIYVRIDTIMHVWKYPPIYGLTHIHVHRRQGDGRYAARCWL